MHRAASKMRAIEGFIEGFKRGFLWILGWLVGLVDRVQGIVGCRSWRFHLQDVSLRLEAPLGLLPAGLDVCRIKASGLMV